jgi:dihydroflavonol-4-reductase
MPPIVSTPVCVTGASGFVASQLIALLLERGYRVRGTVRGEKGRKALAKVLVLPGASERLELVDADSPRSAVARARGQGVRDRHAHRQPVFMAYKDPQKDLVDPAVKGTRDVLAACTAAAGS